MPDSPEYRISQLEQLGAALKQRTDDHESDIRSFAPLVVAHARLEEKLASLQEAITGLRGSISGLTQEIEAERERVNEIRRKREEQERERENRDRRYRIATWIAAIGMFLTFVSTTVGVIALVGTP
jgi:predicted  nucleic acid-binding Zn-ribbon protein